MTTRLVFVTLLLLPIAAAAQVKPAAVGVPATAASAATAAEAPKTADESIYVVQRRTYSKSGKLELTPLFYTSLNNKFVGHFGPGAAAVYHMRENLAVEFITSFPYMMKGYFSALVHDVYQFEDLTPEVVDLKQMRYFNALSVQYSALYGKMELYGYLVDYDFYALAGFGLVSTVETCTTPGEGDCGPDEGNGRGLRSPDLASDRYKISGNLGGGARFFFRDWIGLRVEARDIAYADRAADAADEKAITTDIRNHVLFVMGVSFLL